MDDRSTVDVDVVDEFERLGRLAGAELRQPPPADGASAVLRSAHRRRTTTAVVAAGVTVAVVATGLFVTSARFEDGSTPVATVPPSPAPTVATEPSSPAPVESVPSTSAPAVVTTGPFVGKWVSVDTDGSSQTMEIAGVDGDDYELVFSDDLATAACSGAPATMTGAGSLVTDVRLMFARAALTCDDGTVPRVEFADISFDLDIATGELVDSFGVVWQRADSAAEPIETPPVTATAEPSPPDRMWPQSTLEEVQAAQELADAGDVDHTWQLDAGLAAGDYPGTWNRLRESQVGLVDRFLREVMGWDAYIQNIEGGSDFSLTDQRFLRCAPDRTNPLYPPQPDAEVAGESRHGGRRCAPTLDELTYESVRLDLVQPARHGIDGIWVVSNWQPTTFAQVDPVVAEAQATERLERFLAARIDGNGAEGIVDVYAGWLGREIPLLYGAASGAPYERFEFERVSGPTWPYAGYIGFEIRLFAEDGTVVEQEVYSHWDGGASVGIDGGLALGGTTTANGRPVAMVHALYRGEITYSSPSQSSYSVGDDGFLDFTDPALRWSDCRETTAPDGAAAIAQAIIADPNFETTEPLQLRVGGVEAVAMDVVLAPAGRVCGPFHTDVQQWINSLEPGKKQRLYLLDLPQDMSMRTLAITVTAPGASFEHVMEQAQPIIDSIEFHPA